METVQGQCPKCEKDEITYDPGTPRYDDQSLGYYFECEHCHFAGIEWYHLEFIGMTDSEGNPVK